MVSSVANYSFQLSEFVLDDTFPARLESALRPFALAIAEERLASILAEEVPTGDQYVIDAHDEAVKSARRRVASGGGIHWMEWKVTDAEGFQRTWIATDWYGEDSPPASELNGYQHAEIEVGWPVQEYDWTVKIDSRAGWGMVTIFTDNEHIAPVSQVVREVCADYVRPELADQNLPPFRVFIGHGGDRKWEAVRGYIEAAEYEVVAFETDDRIGRATLEVVEQMISESSVAVIVMTGVDRVGERLLARQNVVHELGFAQGRLGSRNTIILLEEGTEEFSNIASITQVRFKTGEVHTTRDEVLASLANRKRDRRWNGNGGI